MLQTMNSIMQARSGFAGLLTACLLQQACTTNAKSSALTEVDASAQDAAPKAVDYSGGHYALTADWLQQTLSIVDLRKVKHGANYADVVVETMDLSEHDLGPMELVVTPDSKTAIVSVSAGFFAVPGSGIIVNGTVPTGPGELLFVDLEHLKVTKSLQSGMGPMGILLTHEGTQAVVAHFSSSELALIDVSAQDVLDHINVGPYSEELALDDTGEVAIFSYSAAGNIRTFSADDPSQTLSDDVSLTGDAAGVAFFPGTKIAYVVQAPNPLTSPMGGHDLIDVSDPQAPVVLESVRDANAPVSYPAVAHAARGSVIVPAVISNKLQLLEYTLKGDKAELVGTTPVTDVTLFGAFHTTIDPKGRVLCAVPREHLLTSTNLETGESIVIPWNDTAPGPTDVQVIP